MKKIKTYAVAGVVLCGASVTAQATNGDQLLGVTATQWGMAGAVVAAPQDAATVITNPAGIAELGIKDIRFDLSPGFMNPPRSVNGVESGSDLYFMPSGAVAINVNDRLYLGLGMAAQSGFGVDVSDAFPAAPGNQAFVTTKGFFKLAPTIAYKVSDKLSLGVALNIGYQSLALSTPTFTFSQNQQFGFGATLGAVYHVNDRIQLGASWVSKQNVSEHEFNTSGGKYTLDMDVAEQFVFGLAVKPVDGLLVELDAKWINYSDTMDSVTINAPAGNPLATPASLNFGWDDQWVIALGVQKEISPKTTVRFGVNYGESPIGAQDVNQNLGSMAIPEWHLSVGMTRKLDKNLSGSLSYTHAFENDLTSSIAPANNIQIEQNTIYAQISYSL